MTPRDLEAIVVGAGPAGLATSRELSRSGIEHVVLERGEAPGHTWVNLYDSLVLHTGKHLSSLPGQPFPRRTPLFPTRLDFVTYLQDYARTFRAPVMTGARVTSAARDAAGWVVRLERGDDLRARSLVFATGIVANPHEPAMAGRARFAGRVLHSVEYRRPDPFAGRRVLVVGAGNSAGEIAAELAASGVDVTIAVRSGARVLPRQLVGIPIQYVAVALAPLPRRAQQTIQRLTARAGELVRGRTPLPPPRADNCSDVPLIGFHLADALRAGRIRLKRGVAALSERGAVFDDDGEEPFDAVILATGFRPALAPLGASVTVDRCGFAARRDRISSADLLDLYFVGHNYDTRGALRNIGRDARLAAACVAARR